MERQEGSASVLKTDGLSVELFFFLSLVLTLSWMLLPSAEQDPKCYLMIFILHCSSSSSPTQAYLLAELFYPLSLSLSSYRLAMMMDFFFRDDEKPLSVLAFCSLQAI